MLFNSIQYLFFLPTVVFFYWLLPKRWRLPMLLVASYAFYMSWMPVFICLIVPMTLFNWLWGKLLSRATDSKKLTFGAGIAVNLLVLGTFKYASFCANSISSLIGLVGRNPHWDISIILPLGISFFTFEFIHYLFEIYRGRKPIDSFVLFALFAAFFPTQISGQIKRFPDFAQQMIADQKLKLSYFDEGLPLIIIGLAKKVLLADSLSVLLQMRAAQPGAYGALELWLFAYAFAFQIYFDFSGYTDIARGSALLFGYHIPVNFNLPYIARNISDFWHRWHISLSTWLRDYLYIPLGGSRCGRLIAHRNLLITMTLGGLWHGASWNFVVWGVFHGLCLIVHREFEYFRDSISALKTFCQSRIFSLFSTLLTFHVVCIGFVFFSEKNIRLDFAMLKSMLLLRPIFSSSEGGHFVLLNQYLVVGVPIAIALVAFLLLTNFPLSAFNQSGLLKRLPAPIKAFVCTALVLAIIVFLPDDSRPFIYFQF